METTSSDKGLNGTVLVRDASVDDLSDVLVVEASGYDFPWSEAIFRDCFKDSYTFLVLLLDDQIVAYAIISDIVGEAHLLNICVHRDFNRRGLGAYLLHEVIKRARAQNCFSILLEVRQSNVAAKLMYEKFGFSMIGVRKNYYPAADGREDALMYQLDVTDLSVDEQV